MEVRREKLRALAPLVAGIGVLEKPDQRGAALGSMLSAVQTGLAIVSFIAVIVGSFIIYHTMHTAIAMRQRELEQGYVLELVSERGLGPSDQACHRPSSTCSSMSTTNDRSAMNDDLDS